MINKLSPSPKALNHLNHRFAQIADQGHGAVEQRLSELESEWSIGRLVKATTGVLLLADRPASSPWRLSLPTDSAQH